jgi:hypothetical protein
LIARFKQTDEKFVQEGQTTLAVVAEVMSFHP